MAGIVVISGPYDSRSFLIAIHVAARARETCLNFQFKTHPMERDDYWEFKRKQIEEWKWPVHALIEAKVLTWLELDHHGGPRMLIGGMSNFLTFMDDKYGAVRILKSKHVNKYLEIFIDQWEHEKEAAEKSLDDKRILNVSVIGAAANPATRLLLFALLSFKTREVRNGVKLKLYDKEPDSEARLEQLVEEMQAVEGCAFGFGAARIVSSFEEALLKCNLLIFMGEEFTNIDDETADMEEHLLKAKNLYEGYGLLCNRCANKNLRVIFAFSEMACFKATIFSVTVGKKLDTRKIVVVTSHLCAETKNYISKVAHFPIPHIKDCIVWGFVDACHVIDWESGRILFRRQIFFDDEVLDPEKTRASFDEWKTRKSFKEKSIKKEKPRRLSGEGEEAEGGSTVIEEEEDETFENDKIEENKKLVYKGDDSEWIWRNSGNIVRSLRHLWSFVGVAKRTIRLKTGYWPFIAEVQELMNLLRTWYGDPSWEHRQTTGGIVSTGVFDLPKGIVFSMPIRRNAVNGWAPCDEDHIKLPKQDPLGVDIQYVLALTRNLLRHFNLSSVWLKLTDWEVLKDNLDFEEWRKWRLEMAIKGKEIRKPRKKKMKKRKTESEETITEEEQITSIGRDPLSINFEEASNDEKEESGFSNLLRMSDLEKEERLLEENKSFLPPGYSQVNFGSDRNNQVDRPNFMPSDDSLFASMGAVSGRKRSPFSEIGKVIYPPLEGEEGEFPDLQFPDVRTIRQLFGPPLMLNEDIEKTDEFPPVRHVPKFTSLVRKMPKNDEEYDSEDETKHYTIPIGYPLRHSMKSTNLPGVKPPKSVVTVELDTRASARKNMYREDQDDLERTVGNWRIAPKDSLVISKDKEKQTARDDSRPVLSEHPWTAYFISPDDENYDEVREIKPYSEDSTLGTSVSVRDSIITKDKSEAPLLSTFTAGLDHVDQSKSHMYSTFKSPAKSTDELSGLISIFKGSIDLGDSSAALPELLLSKDSKGVSDIPSKDGSSDAEESKMGECTEARKDFVGEHIYHAIFYCEFNLSFHAPRKDICHKCDALNLEIKVALGDEADALKIKHELHLRKAEKARKYLKSDTMKTKENKKKKKIQGKKKSKKRKKGPEFYLKDIYTEVLLDVIKKLILKLKVKRKLQQEEEGASPFFLQRRRTRMSDITPGERQMMNDIWTKKFKDELKNRAETRKSGNELMDTLARIRSIREQLGISYPLPEEDKPFKKRRRDLPHSSKYYGLLKYGENEDIKRIMEPRDRKLEDGTDEIESGRLYDEYRLNKMLTFEKLEAERQQILEFWTEKLYHITGERKDDVPIFDPYYKLKLSHVPPRGIDEDEITYTKRVDEQKKAFFRVVQLDDAILSNSILGKWCPYSNKVTSYVLIKEPHRLSISHYLHPNSPEASSSSDEIEIEADISQEKETFKLYSEMM